MQMGMIDLNPEFQRGMLAAIQKPIVIFLLCIAWIEGQLVILDRLCEDNNGALLLFI